MDILDKDPDEILRNAAHHLMDRTNIWNDRKMTERSEVVWGPEYKAVTLLCRLASDIRLERALAPC